jgi:putative ABC transport system substrate-binding protein
MKRRAFVTGSLAGLAAVRGAAAQTPTVLRRIGYLGSGHPDDRHSPRFKYLFEAFGDGLREAGYIDGQNMTILWKFAEERYERLPQLAAELVRAGVAAIFATTDHAASGARQVTDAVPIVFNQVDDPVASGFAVSLSRPGGNMTGFTASGPPLSGKRLGLLKEAVPRLSRVAVLRNPTGTVHVKHVSAAAEAARALGLQHKAFDCRSADEFERVFAAMAKDRAEAVLMLPDTTFYIGREHLAELALHHRLAVIGTLAEHPRAGMLMGYGIVLSDGWRRSGVLVGKILNGAKPADIPIQEPSLFELVINLKTARALGLTIPQSVLIRADEIIK